MSLASVVGEDETTGCQCRPQKMRWTGQPGCCPVVETGLDANALPECSCSCRAVLSLLAAVLIAAPAVCLSTMIMVCTVPMYLSVRLEGGMGQRAIAGTETCDPKRPRGVQTVLSHRPPGPTMTCMVDPGAAVLEDHRTALPDKPTKAEDAYVPLNRPLPDSPEG